MREFNEDLASPPFDHDKETNTILAVGLVL